jgi:hypothetical protein
MSKTLWYHHLLELYEWIEGYTQHENQQDFELRWDVARAQ